MNELSRNQQEPILKIDDLTVAYRQEDRWLEAVRSFSFQVRPGQAYGLVGESGSGKSTLALAIMRHLPENGVVGQGTIRFSGEDLLAQSRTAMRHIWGKQLAMVPQDPQSALNPSLLVGEQIAEALRHHEHHGRGQARQRTLDILARVRLPDPARVADSYPHQISGGMKQRVLIAMALVTEPSLLVLDEPTTSLDVTTQAAILDLVQDLIRERDTAILYVSHNLGVVAQVCDRVAVLYAGELVEDAATTDLYRQPLHPYTQGLLDSVPRLGETKHQVQLRSIAGRIPSLDGLPSGCVFRTRCPLAVEICQEYPPLYQPSPERRTRCHRWDGILNGDLDPHQPLPQEAKAGERTMQDYDAESETVLAVDDARVHFAVRRSLVEFLSGQAPDQLKAVDGVSLELQPGQTLGLVGESGSGKTTLARAILGLEERTGGSIQVLNLPLPPTLSQRDRETLSHLQIVFQNPEEALNPYLSVGETLRRPLRRLLGLSNQEADARVPALLDAVHLPTDYARRLPAQLSGGEKQRVAIARAFASNPDLLIADEAVSSLDVSVQAAILSLLHELQLEHGSSLLFISHDLAVVGYLADVIAVIYLGKLMEVARATEIFDPPYHPYTEALLSAIPLIDPEAQGEQIRLDGEVPSPVDVPSGCPFHTRCPRFLGDICVDETPPWRVTDSGRRIYCHIPLEELQASQSRSFRVGDSSFTTE